LLDVVPAHEKLVVGARIAPQDIEHVRAGAAAEVRLLGSDARQRPPLRSKTWPGRMPRLPAIPAG
jgi:HlyD family secretion protein